MYKLNSFEDTAKTGRIVIDLGDGTALDTERLKAEAAAAAQAKDTGWRSVPCTDSGAGAILLRRVGDRVRIRLNGMTVAAGSFATYVATIPTGFVPIDEEYFLASNSTALLSDWSRMGIYGASRTKLAWVQTTDDSATRPSAPLRGSWEYDTQDAWPTDLPGMPA